MRRHGGARSSSLRGAAALYALLFLRQVHQLGLFDRRTHRRLPYVTLGLAGACFVLHFFADDLQPYLPFSLALPAASLHPHRIVSAFGEEWPRLFTAALIHASEMHLYWNLTSLLYKGVMLEDRFGSARFGAMCVGLTGAAHLLTVAFSWTLERSPLASFSQYRTHAVGISALLFALKVILNFDPRMRDTHTNVGGFVVANKWAAWAELLFIQLLTPNASFLGHLAGILTGSAWLALDQPSASPFRRVAPWLLAIPPVGWVWQRLQSGRNQSRGYRLGRRDDSNAPPAMGSANARRFPGVGRRLVDIDPSLASQSSAPLG